MIPIPRPLPPRSEWRQFPPAPVDARLRALAAADPGIATYPHAQRSPVRQPQWAAARRADRAETSGMDRGDHGPEIAAQPASTWRPARPGDTPGELTPEHGPIHPIRLDDPAPLDIPRGDPGADIAALLRRRLTALAAAERPLGIHPPPRSPVDPGPHDQEPAAPRWRWWRRARTAWPPRDRKREE